MNNNSKISIAIGLGIVAIAYFLFKKKSINSGDIKLPDTPLANNLTSGNTGISLPVSTPTATTPIAVTLTPPTTATPITIAPIIATPAPIITAPTVVVTADDLVQPASLFKSDLPTASQPFSSLKLITTKAGVDTIVFNAATFANGTSKIINLADGVYDKIRINYATGNPQKMTIVSNNTTYNGINTGGTFSCYNVTIKKPTIIQAS